MKIPPAVNIFGVHPDAIIKLMTEEPRYAAYYAACKYKPQLWFEYLAHTQTFQLMKEGLTDAILKRVKTIIRGKVRNNSSLMKKYHKDETDWTFENWVAAFKQIA